MSPRPVVAAAIVDSLARPSRLLCAARAYPADLAGRFELPGGKIEDGEDPLDALAREIREELGADLVIGPRVDAPDGRWWPILQGRRMGVWLCEVSPDSPAPTRGDSHSDLRWVDLEDLAGLDWIGHDLDIALAVVDRCSLLRDGSR
ncbi:NUDIX domain-containing protein [Actinomyces sp. B33]|uniref:(deoxy)nucleoside triphosphate pyrophosphohydrolase n=1 Tax=Actinomyces sp. B33 TaxID=2942131 RepID=UPI00234275F7|nr:NUDIX domain-containing protein [Actinomyces sp. B33]MDC4233451.1 NUDIX domain-containing protein [Actinomyces sp. B33]